MKTYTMKKKEERLPSFKIKKSVLKKEEYEPLIYAAQEGCLKSRNKLLEHNLGLVANESYKLAYIQNPVLEYEDLFQQGVFGLIRAIEKFDSKKDVAFSTYAVLWIKQSIRRYILDNKDIIRTPVYASEIKSQYEKIKKQDTDKDDDFWIQLVATEKGMSVENVRHIVTRSHTFSSLDKTFDGEDDTIQIVYDLFTDEYHQGIDYHFMLRIMNLLSDRERKMLLARYDGDTLQELADKYEMSRERIRQIVNNSLTKVRAMIKLRQKVRGIFSRNNIDSSVGFLS